MEKKEFATIDEVKEFVNPMVDEKKWVIDVRQKGKEGPFLVQWCEHKMYTTLDGKEFHDEVWRKEDGTIMLVQDIELEHARNIIRMILRQDREAEEAGAMLREKIAAILESGTLGDYLDGIDDDNDGLPEGSYQVPGSTTLQ